MSVGRLRLSPEQIRAAKWTPWVMVRPGMKERVVSLKMNFIDRRFFCQDCEDEHYPEYVLKSEVWFQVIGNKQERLCPACFEKKLGRKITIDDLEPRAGANAAFFAGAKMPKGGSHA